MQRIAVTGLSVMCGLGNNKAEFLEGLRSGRTSIRPVRAIADLDRYPIQLGCEIPDSESANVVRSPSSTGLDRITETAIAVVDMALADAGFRSAPDFDEIGVSLATCMGGILSRELFARAKRSESAPNQHLMRQVPHAVVTGHVAKHFGFGGPLATIVTACAAGTHAIGLATDHLRSGRASVMIAGGVDPFSSVSFSGFTVLGALSKNQAAPFSANRTGLILGEASAFVVLENESQAIARGARIYGYVRGYGLSNDAYHPTTPDPTGKGAVRAMRAALVDAQLRPEQIEYVNAHGTGTKYNDDMELAAMREVFGEHAPRLAISSTKSQLGHTLGAAGAVEFVATVLSLHEGFIPATVGCNEPMNPDWNFVPNTPQRRPIQFAMSNSFAFGGNTASLVVERA